MNINSERVQVISTNIMSGALGVNNNEEPAPESLAHAEF